MFRKEKRMSTIRVRKHRSGGVAGRYEDGRPWSFTWENDGDVVEIPNAVAAELLSTPEWGFSAAEDEPATGEAEAGDDATAGDPETDLSIEEPAPTDGELSEAPPARKSAAKRAAKKTAPSEPVEE